MNAPARATPRRLGLLPVGPVEPACVPAAAPPALRLFCFPYAGGGPAVYRRWPARVPAGCEVWSFQFPGQGPRFHEAHYTDWRRLVDDACDAILRLGWAPFALFGHSMGGLLAFECARALRRRGAPTPLHLGVSGCRAPGRGLRGDLPRIAQLPRAAFVEELRRMGGTPRGVLESPELLDLVLPHLRADFAMAEAYVYLEEPPLDLPLAVWVGSADPIAPRVHCLEWAGQTTRGLALEVVEGGHFFLHHDDGLAGRVAEAALAAWRALPRDTEVASVG